MEILSPQIITLFILFGSLAGLLAGLLGIGGGVILVPLFLWAFPLAGFEAEVIVHAAFGTSLAIIFPTSISSTLGHRKRNNVEWHHVAFLALGGVGGSIVGASLAAALSGMALKALFGLMQVGIGMKMFISRTYLPPEDRMPPAWRKLVLVGFAAGAFSSFFGVGGGVVAVPLMVLFLRLPIHLAVGNSSALIVISSLSSTILYIIHGWGEKGLAPFSLGYVNVLVALMVGPLTILFARFGVRLASHFSHDRLMKVFSLILILVGTRLAVGFIMK